MRGWGTLRNVSNVLGILKKIVVTLTRDTVLVSKGLELAVGPAVEDPVLGAGPRVLGSVLSLIPRVLDLSNKRVLVGLGALLGLDALLLEVSRELVRVPVLVGRDGVVLPVLLDQVLEVLAVGRGGVRDIVVREPALELGLMPLVVCCISTVNAMILQDGGE